MICHASTSHAAWDVGAFLGGLTPGRAPQILSSSRAHTTTPYRGRLILRGRVRLVVQTGSVALPTRRSLTFLWRARARSGSPDPVFLPRSHDDPRPSQAHPERSCSLSRPDRIRRPPYPTLAHIGPMADVQRRRRAVPKMLRTIWVPAVRANCLKALEPVICSTTDFSRRCELRGWPRAAARASRSA